MTSTAPLKRASAQREVSMAELDRLCSELGATGSGMRNGALNVAAMKVGHFVGAGSLSRAEAEHRLTTAARRMGLAASEARSTIRSGLDAGVRDPAFREDRSRTAVAGARRTPAPTSVSASSLAADSAAPAVDHFPSIAETLCTSCPLSGEPDVVAYLKGRGLPTDATADVFALPPPAGQAALIARLLEKHGDDAVLSTGLVRRDLKEMLWPAHRLGIAWRNAYGMAIDTLQFRLAETPRGGVKKALFAKGRAVRWPFGLHRLAQCSPSEPVLIVEGPTDWLAQYAIHPSFAGRCVALPSATRLRDEWVPHFAGRQVFVALDADEAGERAAIEIMGQLAAVAAPLRVRPFPGSKDWGDLAAQRQTSTAALLDEPNERAAIIAEVSHAG